MNKRVEEILNYELGIDEVFCIENALERIYEINPKITVKQILEILKSPLTND